MKKEYDVAIPGLAEVIAQCKPTTGHRLLLEQLRKIDGLAGLELATTRGEDGGSYLSKRKVLAADGTIVHDEHLAWMAEQFEADGRSAQETYRRLRAAGYRLSRCDVVTLYFTLDRGTQDAADFVQLELFLEDERADREVLSEWPFRKLLTLKDLVEIITGSDLVDAERVQVRAPAYRFRRLVDIGQFVQLAEAAERQERERNASRRYVVSDSVTGQPVGEKTLAELDPNFGKYPSKARRLFDDWQASSAGRSGERLCKHWVMELSDWTDSRTGHRYMGLIPLWTFSQKLAEVDARKGDVYTFFGKLNTLDRRVGVPLGWYFYMLHDNRVHGEAAERVLKAAEDGLIVLPEHDYRVLQAWRARPYSF